VFKGDEKLLSNQEEDISRKPPQKPIKKNPDITPTIPTPQEEAL